MEDRIDFRLLKERLVKMEEDYKQQRREQAKQGRKQLRKDVLHSFLLITGLWICLSLIVIILDPEILHSIIYFLNFR